MFGGLHAVLSVFCHQTCNGLDYPYTVELISINQSDISTNQREGMGPLEYQTMAALRDVAHDGVLCTFSNRSSPGRGLSGVVRQGRRHGPRHGTKNIANRTVCYSFLCVQCTYTYSIKYTIPVQVNKHKIVTVIATVLFAVAYIYFICSKPTGCGR